MDARNRRSTTADPAGEQAGNRVARDEAAADGVEQAPDDPGLADTAKLLHGMALLAEGGELAEPAAFVAILSRRLEQTLS